MRGKVNPRQRPVMKAHTGIPKPVQKSVKNRKKKKGFNGAPFVESLDDDELLAEGALGDIDQQASEGAVSKLCRIDLGSVDPDVELKSKFSSSKRKQDYSPRWSTPNKSFH